MSEDDETLDSAKSDLPPDEPETINESPGADIPDSRLYVPDHEDWDVRIKRDSERIYCYSKHPGEDWFHLILGGEIYLTRQHERYCLRCALRMNVVTLDRLFWQHRLPKKQSRVL